MWIKTNDSMDQDSSFDSSTDVFVKHSKDNPYEDTEWGDCECKGDRAGDRIYDDTDERRGPAEDGGWGGDKGAVGVAMI